MRILCPSNLSALFTVGQKDSLIKLYLSTVVRTVFSFFFKQKAFNYIRHISKTLASTSISRILQQRY